MKLYSGVKKNSDIERAKEREYKKALEHVLDTNYIFHFKMVFEKDKIKSSISEESYINTDKVPYNEVTRRIKKEYSNKDNIYVDWDKFDSNKKMIEFVEKHNMYPEWVKYDWINGTLIYNNEYIKRHTSAVLENFRLNMSFYDRLNKSDFDKALNQILKMKENKNLKEVIDLKDFFGVKGIYVMILDKYKQIYIGQSKRDVVARIIQHWTKKVEFENLMIGRTESSKLRIDSFGLLDTTRIFIEEVEESQLDKREKELVSLIPEEYLINLVAGGLKLDGLASTLKFVNTYKRRKLK